MTYLSMRDWIFSAKTFVAAMLALYIAFFFELPRPYWAMATVYIVSNPFVGATRSKAVYRALGTFVGAAAAIILVPPLAETPLLLSGVTALWIGAFLYLAISTRTARAYVFTLASYTLPIIAFAAVDNPTGVFDIAVTRVEEILVGIVCSSVIGSVILPNPLAPTIGRRNEAWFADAINYASHALRGDVNSEDLAATRRRMAAHIRGLDVLLSQLAYDHASPSTLQHSDLLYGRMQLLMPVLSSLGDTLNAWHRGVNQRHAEQAVQQLEHDGEPLSHDLQHENAVDSLLLKVGQWFAEPLDQAPNDTAQQLLAEIDTLEPLRENSQHAPWEDALLSHLLWRLSNAIDIWQDCKLLRSIILRDAGTWRPHYRHWQVGVQHHYLDYGVSLFSAGTAVLVMFIASTIWILTGWQDGGAAVSLGAVASGLFAAVDEPVAMIMIFFTATCGALLLAGGYEFLVLPNISDFPLLMLFFALAFIPLGLFMAKPKFALITTLTSFMTALTLSIGDAYSNNVLTFLNGNIATAAGILFAGVMTSAIRPFGVQLAAVRLIRSSWRDVAASAVPMTVRAQRALHGRMLDRLIQLIPRTQAGEHGTRSSLESLRDMRIALNTVALRRHARKRQGYIDAALAGILDGVTRHFQQCLLQKRRLPAPIELAERIDQAVARVTVAPIAILTLKQRTDILHGLVGLRLSLYPEMAKP